MAPRVLHDRSIYTHLSKKESYPVTRCAETFGQTAKPENRAAVRQYFEHSQAYLEDLRTHDERYHRQFLNLVRRWIPRGATVLEVGCGTGVATRLLASESYRPVGVDLSTFFLREGGQQGKIPLVAADAECLPFPSGCFDAVIGFEFIEHVGDVPGVLTELVRVLEPGGLLLIHSPNLCSPVFPVLDLLSLLLGRGGRPVFAETLPQAVRWLATNVRATVRKMLLRFPEFLYREPDLSGRHIGGDADSLYLACQIDLARYLRRQHMRILLKAWGHSPPSRALARLMPGIAPYIAIVARKPLPAEEILRHNTP